MNSRVDTGTLIINGPYGPAVVARPTRAQVMAAMRYILKVMRESEEAVRRLDIEGGSDAE